jgi:hypothetical protein
MFLTLLSVFEKSGYLLLELLPYILLGVLLAEVLKYTPWTRLVREAMGNTPVLSILISSLIGVVSPLCTYGTIPIVIQLYRGGVSLAPLLTFLSASSLMNSQVEMYFDGRLLQTFTERFDDLQYVPRQGLSGVEKGSHKVVFYAYDRFLNCSSQTVMLVIP